MYSFLSGFKNVKKVILITDELCGTDIIDAMKRLAENDTIESLDISFCKRLVSYPCAYCTWNSEPHLDNFDNYAEF